MNRLKLLIAGLFAVALGSGVLVGMGVSRSAHYQDRREWMAEVLNLTPVQKTQMEEIWSEDRTHRQSVSERSHQAQKEHDDAVQALLTPDQKTAVAKIDDKYKEEMLVLNHERDEAFKAAVENTKTILTPAKRDKYDELLKGGFRGSGRPDGRVSDGHGGPDGPWHGASTRHGGDGAASTRNSPATAPAPQSMPEGAPH